jgi:hypothetical protein
VALTTGKVERLVWDASLVEAYLDAAPSPFRIRFGASDYPEVLAAKTAMSSLLVRAHLAAHPVNISHGDASRDIDIVDVAPHCEIALVAESPIAVHADLFSVTGVGIPADDPPIEALTEDWEPRSGDVCALEFEVGDVRQAVAVTFSRPHLAVVAELPTTVPIGVGTVRLISKTSVSAPIAVEVSAGPIPTTRVVQPGAAKPRPFSCTFMANRRGDLAAGNVSDVIVEPGNRGRYNRAVTMTLWGLWGCRSDVFSAGGRDAEWRIVSIYDPSLGGGQANTLVFETDGFYPYADRAAAFAARYGENPDISIVVQAFSSRDGAVETLDDMTTMGPPFTYDTRRFSHRPFATQAGAMQMYAPTELRDELIPRQAFTALALHEFLHAVSSRTDGHIDDLYDDAVPSFVALTVNKKFRSSAGSPIPETFARYNGVAYRSAPDRAPGDDYPPTWTSYHPERIRPTRGNIMNHASGVGCYPDRLTDAFLRDRMRAKLGR